MRVAALKIENYRNIRYLEMVDIPDIIVLAGANGCGKSSVLDAIVLAKEATGAYYSAQTSPRQVNVGAEYAQITLTIETTEQERAYIQENNNANLGGLCSTTIRLDKTGSVRHEKVDPGLHQLFATYARFKSPEIGVVEYLPSQRVLTPKSVNSYSAHYLDEAHWKQTALSRQQSRFDDIKEYLAALAFRAAQEAVRMVHKEGIEICRDNYPDQFLEIKSVFRRFFSPMEFSGVWISENPFEYAILTPSGEIDLDDLSDGEKAVFTIAFDIIRRNLRNSIVLFDEPELHLHADLARRFVEVLPTLRPGNQFWLTTHSAELLRSVEPASVFRIVKLGTPGATQAQRVFSNAAMRQTLADLVGEVGLVTLNKKIVFLEGSGNEIDRYILETLYSDRLDRVQFVSCGSAKGNTRVSAKILELLDQASEFNFFYAIRDHDFMTEEERAGMQERGRGRLWVWDTYHIENYLLDWSVLYQTAQALCGPSCPFSSPDEIEDICLEIADGLRDKFLALRLDQYILESTYRPRSSVDPSRPLTHAKEIAQELCETVEQRLSVSLESWAVQEQERIDQALADGSWVRVFPGRLILAQLAGRLNVRYEQLRNVAVARLKEQSIPDGISAVMAQILDEEQG